ncbi:MAG: aspartate aminotransferase family protein [Planctomycetaceae bacterium]|nr:aspartate aminotransferase family protein [Planctomycetaceae bacterium]
MTPEEFRRHGHQVVDWIADYLGRVDQFPVLSRVQPGEIRAQLPKQPPQQSEPFGDLLRDVEEIVLPGITHWQSPNFFAFFPCNSSGPSILGELLSAGLGVQGMLWATSPACTELETHVLDWVAQMLALPDHFQSKSQGGGVIQDSASSASLCALLAAREQATQGESNRRGVYCPLVAYTSQQAHSSIEKAMRIAGLGDRQLRRIETDTQFALRPDRLAEEIARDRAAGNVPFLVAATVGTTSSGAIDPLSSIGEICQRERLWLHVDAAMAGTAAVCPEHRLIHQGLEFADSYCFNPHKWMFVNFDCDCFFVRRRDALTRALSILPEYLRNTASESGEVIDYRDWQIPLGRRFRALKLWFVIRSFGVEGIQCVIRRHIQLAEQFVSWVGANPDFELAAPRSLNLVCFRHRGGDTINQQILDRTESSGALYLTHTRLHDELVLRLSVGQFDTQQEHLEQAWALIQKAAVQELGDLKV